MTEQAKKKIENVYKYSSNSIEKIEAAKFGHALASQEHREEVEMLKARVKELEDALRSIEKYCDNSGLESCDINNAQHMAIYHSLHFSRMLLGINQEKYKLHTPPTK